MNKGKGKGKATGAAIAAAPAPAATSTAEVDKECPKAGKKGVSVVADYDAKMNQTNISANNNKFYILQVPVTYWFSMSQNAHDIWGAVRV